LSRRWDDYTTAKVAMFRATDTEFAPWTVVKSNDEKVARIEVMRGTGSRGIPETDRRTLSTSGR
jgi:polyphosphate kinase 2 (PPK2 family)